MGTLTKDEGQRRWNALNQAREQAIAAWEAARQRQRRAWREQRMQLPDADHDPEYLAAREEFEQARAALTEARKILTGSAW